MAARRSRPKVHNASRRTSDRTVRARRPESFEPSEEQVLRAMGSRAASTISRGTVGLSAPAPLPALPSMGDDGKRVSAAAIEEHLPTVLAAVIQVDHRPDRDAALREVLRAAMRWAAGVRREQPEKGKAERLAGPLYLRALRRFQREASGEDRNELWPPPMTGREALLASSGSNASFEEAEAELTTRHLRELLYECYEEFGPPPPRVYAVLRAKGPSAAAHEYAAVSLGISRSKVRDILRAGDGVWWSQPPQPPVRKLSKR